MPSNRLGALWSHAWQRKSIADAAADAAGGKFKRVLGTRQLTLSGMGFVLGSGIFVLTGAIAAKYAGPAACIAFVLAAIPAGLAALCYAEMVTLVPGGGGAFTYASVGLGELPGFLVGWMLSLTYVGGCSVVGVGWAAYVSRLLADNNLLRLPDALTGAPWRWDAVTHTLQSTGGYVNLPAAGIILTMAAVMLLGARESVGFTAILVLLKLAVIFTLLIAGAPRVDPDLWTPFVPPNSGRFGQFGLSGLLQGAGVAMFAYLGVDNICTAAQEAREPQHSIPRAIGATLAVCAVLYVGVCLVLTGLVPYAKLDVEDPIAVGIAATHYVWLQRIVQVGAVAGLTSVLLMQMYGLPRILFAMAKEGLAPRWVGELSAGNATPARGVLLMGGIAAVGAALLPLEMLGGVAANGTMLTFMAVSLSVLRLRRSDPQAKRAFAVPGGPWVVPVAAMVGCGGLVAIAPASVLAGLGGWIVLGIAVYAGVRARGGAPPPRAAAQPG